MTEDGPDVSWAPWSDAEVASLNDFQKAGVMHGFTCGGFHGRAVLLIATNEGWECPECDYIQGWAHLFMVNRSWEVLLIGLDW